MDAPRPTGTLSLLRAGLHPTPPAHRHSRCKPREWYAVDLQKISFPLFQAPRSKIREVRAGAGMMKRKEQQLALTQRGRKSSQMYDPQSELWVLVQVTLPCWASGHLPMARGGWPRSSTPLGVCKSPKCLQSTGLGGREENDQEAREGSGNAPAHGGPRNTAPIRTRRPYTEEGSPSSPYKPPHAGQHSSQ